MLRHIWNVMKKRNVQTCLKQILYATITQHDRQSSFSPDHFKKCNHNNLNLNLLVKGLKVQGYGVIICCNKVDSKGVYVCPIGFKVHIFSHIPEISIHQVELNFF